MGLRVFSAALLLLLVCSCKGTAKHENINTFVPVTLGEVVRHDWQINGALVTDAMLKKVRQESVLRKGLFAASAYIDSARVPGTEEELRLLDNALLFSVFEISPEHAEGLFRQMRRYTWIKNYSDIEVYLALDGKNQLSSKERSQLEFLKVELATELECPAEKLVSSFDFSTLPDYTLHPVLPALPKWIDSENRMRWVKLLYNLPQEVMRTPELDRRKLAELVIGISFRCAAHAAADGLTKLSLSGKNEKETARVIYARRQLSARLCERFAAITPENTELDFLRDMYTLAK